MKKISISLITLLLGACAISSQAPAPIVNGGVKQSAQVATTPPPKVVSNSSAAVSSSPVAKVDNTQNNGTKISKMDDEDSEGTPVSTKKSITKTSEPANVTNSPVIKQGAYQADAKVDGIIWTVPTQGSIIKKYSVASKGIDIAGNEGQAIIAANDGTVAYSGNGLKGYGNLIIIKHANNYLTAYSHNKVNLVKEGESIKRGQKIAEMGSTSAARSMLHFELRKNGKPIDPTAIFQGGDN
ncbi:MAG: peptidoglycan DD-metalloendopeptidase family protein [Burkholderiales bacterium]|nr:peptidoglycan DD-metalloendopeptidase family protein [Burkholderiales bacterium]